MKRKQPLRSDPAKQKAWQERSRKNLPRETPMKTVNRERKAERYEVAYGPKATWIRSLRCYVTAREGGTVAAHTRHSRGAGGTSEDLVPFHALVEIDWHGLDAAKFEEKYGVSKQACKDAAEEYETTWRLIQAGETHLEF